MSGTLTAPVVVDGATGYVGSNLVSALCAAGHQVRCIVRPDANPDDLDFLRSCGAGICTADLLDPGGALVEAMKGAGVAVHLIGSIAPRRGESPEKLHGGQTERLVEHCPIHGVKKIVLVTALGTASGAPSAYHSSKARAEEILKSSGLDYAIVRPSLIVGRKEGRRDSKLVERFRRLIATRNAVPLVGRGQNRIQPLFVGDLVLALKATIETERWDGMTLEIGGADVVTMRQFVEELMRALGVGKPIMAVPPALAFVAAFFSQLIQDRPLISMDQVTLSLADNVCSENKIYSLLGGNPTPLWQALATYSQAETAGSLPAKN